jgi:hypothetical protein
MLKLGNTYEEVMRIAPSAVFTAIDSVCQSYNEGVSDVDYIGKDFNSEIGGDFLLVEAYEDLKDIYTPIESKLPKAQQSETCGGWASILETPSSFDVCEWIDEEKTFVGILLCTNDAGGTTFYVPAEIVSQCPNIEKSIEMTKEAWNAD